VLSGLTLSGCVNSDHSLLVNATGLENLQVTGGGQAAISAVDGLFTQLQIDPTNFTASAIVVNINANSNGNVTFTDYLGASATVSVSGNGNNFFTLTGGDLNSITLQASSGMSFSQVEQVRFESSVISAVPEPQEWAMLLGGLAVVSSIIKRRKAE
jgi:hypothetical protein